MSDIRILKRGLLNGALASGLLALAMAVPAIAADQAKQGDDTTMPATEHQSESLENVPDDADSRDTQESGETTGDMPTTESQQEHLEEKDNMSSDDGESDSDQKQ